MSDHSTVLQIRDFNRFYTKVLGLLNSHILFSDFSLTEARILLEIKTIEACTAKKLIEKLDIDRGYLSRILKKFENGKLIKRSVTSSDKRMSVIALMDLGIQKLRELESKSNFQIEELLNTLDTEKKDQVLSAMGTIKTLLGSQSHEQIRSFQKEDLPFIVDAHRDLYNREYGYNKKFVQYVADAVTAFSDHYDADRENIWILDVNHLPKGVIAIVKETDTTAQLRWFLLDQSLRGGGFGHKLLDEAIQFCCKHAYKKVVLWTVSDLKAARHLYKNKGFRLVERHENQEWTNHVIIEEKWELLLE
ncbi:bifunctional helix-turn-helix transcriptional regulator/GNAT family N-acetyltransferase [Sporolactobacillus pectinivorans]|uniref:bifunctional helix-turn-helix transcriptional regulator/GNAT family N-acetyltransferase n=1 Tax=Sporolactobacillus pectinivorans TaxID=1591408 RepID=UPI0013905C09|nr:helix-turn-helix domain-containing GNAT family N-acetyltransferase [Sporolactobacillus pectinivorans]